MRIRILIALVPAVLALSCNKTVIVEEVSAEKPMVLDVAIKGWPEDSTKGICATGLSLPGADQTSGRAEINAETGALSRMLATMRETGMVPAGITDNQYFGCIERAAERMYVRRSVTPGNRVEISLFLPDDQARLIVDCLSE